MAPRWRRLFDTWEKAVAPGLEDLTASTEFRQAMGSATRLNAAVARRLEEASRQWLHAMNLPAATDVRELRRQISSLEDEVSSLRRAVRTGPVADHGGTADGSPAHRTGGNRSTNGTSAGRSARPSSGKSTERATTASARKSATKRRSPDDQEKR